jgi:hypothetical protein
MAPGGKAAAAKALTILEKRGLAARVDPRAKREVVVEFAAKGIPIFGQAFDAIRRDSEGRTVLIEVKATTAKAPAPHFGGHFFSLTTAELLVAQKLGSQYVFAFVNVVTEEVELMTLREMLGRAKSIYPTWSIRLDHLG